MGTSVESKMYPDVVVRIHKDIESGIIMTKSYNILKNETQVRDNLTVMCLKHDLKCYDCSQAYGGAYLLCTLRSFDDITKMIEHIKTKANKSKYSFKLKGKFALATIGEKKYIYRITLKKEES
jgi:hypothetical protein